MHKYLLIVCVRDVHTQIHTNLHGIKGSKMPEFKMNMKENIFVLVWKYSVGI